MATRLVLSLVLSAALGACARPRPSAPLPAVPAERERPRVIVSSDFPPPDVIPGGLGHGPPEKRSDPDDLQSFVRLLLYANELRIEALVAASGTLANVARKQNIVDMLAPYDAVDEALRAHDPAYPTAADLRARVLQGLSGTYGRPAAEILGEGKDTEASRRITEIVDGSAEPVWFLAWGGSQELAQALWRAQQERTPEALARFVGRLRVYLIAHQDGTGDWLETTFPQLFVITSVKAFAGMSANAQGSDAALADGAWLERHVRTGHGPLGAAYPAAGWSGTPMVVEGDTPSFFYLLSGTRGLAALDDPTLGGWGGRFLPRAPGSRQFADAPEGKAAVFRWREAFQRDFAARMDRCVRAPAEVNHAPVAVVDGDHGIAPLRRTLPVGAALTLDARGSRDRDRHPLSFRWWLYREASSYTGELALDGVAGPRLTVRAPHGAVGEAHLVLEVTDGGAPALTSYRRVIVRVGGP